MKKVLRVLMMILVVLTPFFGVDAKSKTTTAKKDPINFYIFYGATCGFCQNLHEYTAELEKDKSVNYMFNIVDLEVWKNQENNDLMMKVGAHFDFDVDGVPFYVIGDKYFTGFHEENSPAQIVDAIKKAYNNKDYVDIVDGIADGKIEVADRDVTEEDEKKKNDTVGYIILGITAVIVIAIIFGRTNTKYYEEEIEEDTPVVEVKEEKKEEIKKETPKKSSTKTTEAKKSTTKKTTKKTTNKSTTTKKNTKK